MIKPLRITVRIILFAAWSIVVPAAQTIVLMFSKGPVSYKIPKLWHRGLCKVFGIDVRVVGTPLPTHQGPVLFVSNHLSYLDILAIGSFLEASFVAKKEVASWPVFGFLSSLQQTAFISRSAKDALKEKNSLQSYLNAGKSIILFPEGTTTDGSALLPFKSSLFALALDKQGETKNLKMQPFTLRTIPKPDVSKDDDGAAIYPWYGDMTLLPHVLEFAGGKGCIVELIFHDPIDPATHDDRKALSKLTQTMVWEGYEAGQPQAVPALLTDERSTP